MSSPAAILHFASRYSIYFYLILFPAALVGNLINILVFTQLKFFRTNRCVFYLTIESVFDLLYYFYDITYVIFHLFYGTDPSADSLVWCRLRTVFPQSCGLTISFMSSLAAADQFFSTNCQFYLRQTCTIKLARYLVIAVMVFAIAHGITFSFFTDTVPSIGCIISNPVVVRYATYFFYPILISFLPVIIASSFSMLAYRNVRRIVRRQIPIQRRRFDRQITAMVLIRVIFFVICLLPFLIVRIYIINHPIPQSNPLLFAITQSVQAIALSIVSLTYVVRLVSNH